MASLTYNNGRPVVQFPKGGKNAGRASIRLGKLSRKDAQAACGYIHDLVNARDAGAAIPRKTALWLAEIGDQLHAKLAKHRLVEPRQAKAAVALAAFCDSYIKRRTDLKERTLINLRQCRRVLVAHFGEGRDLRTITRSEMKDWHRGLLLKLGGPTVATHVKKARQFFNEAIDQGAITESPMKGIKAGSQKNDARKQYVPAADVEKVIALCPDSDWRMYFALARYGGLRIPSESSRLRWSDIDFDNGRMIVHAPKTERHEGRGKRTIPLYAELLRHLRAAMAEAEPDAKYVIARRFRATPRTLGAKLVERAGVTSWPRLFQNLRASCQTDLAAHFLPHVVCAWMGNTPEVARSHYLMVTERDFTAAIGWRAAKSAAATAGSDRKTEPENAKNPQKTEGLSQDRYPQGGAKNPANPMRIPKSPSRALQKALQRRGVSPFRGKAFARKRLAAATTRKAVGR